MGPTVTRWAAPLGVAAYVVALVLGTSALSHSGLGVRNPVSVPREVPRRFAPSPTPVLPVLTPETATVTGYSIHLRELTVTYLVSDPACTGVVAEPDVDEAVSSVTVYLRPGTPREPTPTSCPEPVRTETAHLLLAGGLGSRAILDGGRGGAIVPLVAP